MNKVGKRVRIKYENRIMVTVEKRVGVRVKEELAERGKTWDLDNEESGSEKLNEASEDRDSVKNSLRVRKRAKKRD